MMDGKNSHHNSLTQSLSPNPAGAGGRFVTKQKKPGVLPVPNRYSQDLPPNQLPPPAGVS